MRHLRPAFELRQRYHYNNQVRVFGLIDAKPALTNPTLLQMYMLGSYLVTKYSGMTYMEFVKQRVWQPLNMSSSTFSPTEANADGKLTQVWSEDRRIPIWMTDELIALNAGPGGIISNAVDMVSQTWSLEVRY